MSGPEVALTSALAEWRRLAEAEGNAIRAGNWGFVAECQKALSQLRPVIDHHTDRRNGGSSEAGKHRNTAKATVLELIELQRRNLLSLEQRRRRLSEHIENLARAGKNLRALKRSYSMPLPAAWSSYS